MYVSELKWMKMGPNSKELYKWIHSLEENWFPSLKVIKISNTANSCAILDSESSGDFKICKTKVQHSPSSIQKIKLHFTWDLHTNIASMADYWIFQLEFSTRCEEIFKEYTCFLPGKAAQQQQGFLSQCGKTQSAHICSLISHPKSWI